jgi:hypothetical protein
MKGCNSRVVGVKISVLINQVTGQITSYSNELVVKKIDIVS